MNLKYILILEEVKYFAAITFGNIYGGLCPHFTINTLYGKKRRQQMTKILTILFLALSVVSAGLSHAETYTEVADVTTINHTIAEVPGVYCYRVTAYNGNPAPVESESDMSPMDCEELTAGNALSISWTAPTHNVDGTLLTDLVGYKVYRIDFTVPNNPVHTVTVVPISQ